MKEVLSHSDAASSRSSAFITIADIYSVLKRNKIQMINMTASTYRNSLYIKTYTAKAKAIFIQYSYLS